MSNTPEKLYKYIALGINIVLWNITDLYFRKLIDMMKEQVTIEEKIFLTLSGMGCQTNAVLGPNKAYLCYY